MKQEKESDLVDRQLELLKPVDWHDPANQLDNQPLDVISDEGSRELLNLLFTPFHPDDRREKYGRFELSELEQGSVASSYIF